MANLRDIAAELTRALCVLALLVFGLGAAPSPQSQIGASPAVAAAIAQSLTSELCGGGFGDDHAHVACHACRTAAPLLPPPPCAAVPVSFASARVVYTTDTPVLADSIVRGPPRTRAPPAV